MDLACTSDEGEVTALITCEDQYQIAKCTPRTKLNKLVFHFSTSHVYTSCSASCPGGSANITIKGTLAYVDDNLISRGSSVASERRTASRYYLRNWTNERKGAIAGGIMTNNRSDLDLGFLLRTTSLGEQSAKV
ncbi:hypothetical protein OSTOST_21112 [Ostertagia ostertagi]